ncbi:MAG: site-2 protease family protein [Patescibacteria group bacterium]
MLITFFSLIVLILSVMIHEIAHGSMAFYLGDNTAKREGRLTLNPLKHLDPLGSVILPLMLAIMGSPFVVGWAKPVPINPYNFRDQKWGELKVSIAGPAANFLVAIIFGLLIRFFPISEPLFDSFRIIVVLNLVLGIFNLIPVPPLDGSWILMTVLPEKFANFKILLRQYGIFILIFLIFFSGLDWIFSIAAVFFRLVSGHPL